MSEQPMLIPRGSDYLVADISAGGADGVIFLPGWAGTRFGPQRILWMAADVFVARGYTTARLDFRGRGDSAGDPQQVTLDDMIEDTLAVADWLRAQHGVQRLTLCGLCSGGNVALGAASLRDDVAHVVCWSLLPFMEHKAQAARQGTPRGALLRGMLRKVCRLETWRKLLRGEANVRGAVKVLVKDKEGDAEEQRRKTSRRDILGDLEERFHCRLHLIYGTRDPEAAARAPFSKPGAANAAFRSISKPSPAPRITSTPPTGPRRLSHRPSPGSRNRSRWRKAIAHDRTRTLAGHLVP